MSVNFREAALRSHKDGVYLHDAGRLATADHLYGLASECALKAIMIAFNVPTDASGSPKRPYREHVDVLWNEFVAYMSGRAGANYLSFIPTTNPFVDWKVEHRYEEDALVTQPRAVGHRTATEAVMKMLEQAILDGKVK